MASERKNIKRNLSRPKVNEKGMVQTETLNRYFPRQTLDAWDRMLFNKGIY